MRAIAVRLLARGTALLITVLPGVSLALGLGDIEVNTALNQPLYAEIKLHSIHQDELEDMRVAVASDAAFKRAGIDRPFVLNKLRFAPKVNKVGQTVIEITSQAPVREPFLNFLLEVQWPNGRLLREYTILLDPPVMFEQTDTVGIQPPVTDQGGVSADSSTNQPSSAAANESKYQRYPVSRTEQRRISPLSQPRSETYQTKSGDTLSEIATDLRPNEDIGLPQMMIALLRANPESFIRGNINELMAGVILRVPTQEELAAVDSVQASAEVLQHNTLWRQYRAKLTADVPTKPSGRFEGRIQPSAEEGQSEESSVPVETVSDDRLEILAADEDETEKAGNPAYDAELSELRKDAVLARELAESRSAENEELKSKVRQLEEMLADQERLINLQSDELATLQKRLSTVEEDAAVAVEAIEDDPSAATAALDADGQTEESDKEAAEIGVPAEADQETVASDESDVESADRDAVIPQADSSDQEASVSAQQESGQAQTTENNESEGMPFATDVSDSPVVSETQVEPSNSEPPAVPEAQGEPLETPAHREDATNLITENPMILAALSGIGLLLVVLTWLFISRFKKRKAAVQNELLDDQQDQSLDSTAHLDSTTNDVDDAQVQGIGEEIESHAASASAAGDIEPKSTSEQPRETISGSEEKPESGRSAATPDQDDTLTEADVYIAYNLHQQAEDLLKEALAGDPERDDYRIKLLENYCAANDKESFAVIAEELRARTGGSGERWEHVQSLANKISPDQSLLTGAAQGGDGVASAQPQTYDVDAGMASDDDRNPDTDTVGDMGSGYLSELEKEPEAESLDFTPSSPEDGSKDALEFDVNDLDLSFQTGSAEVPASEEGEQGSSDYKSLDFDLSELGIDLDADSLDGHKREAEQLPEMVDTVPSDDDNPLTGNAESQPWDDAVSISEDSESDKPIDESDIYTSDAEFEQSTNAIELDEGSSIDSLSEVSAADDGLVMSLDEEETEILKPLSSEPSADSDLDLSIEEAGSSDFVTSDYESDVGMHDGLEDELSFDEVKLDWPSDDTAQVESADKVSTSPDEVDLDHSSESLSSFPTSGLAEVESDVIVGDDRGESDLNIADADEPVEDSLESEDLADVESILTNMSDDRSEFDSITPVDADSAEEISSLVEDSGLGVQDERVLEGNADNAFEAIDPSEEVNTKLDLAKAYIDMGDAEGARGALEEVLHQGDQGQRSEAESLLKQIA